MQRTPQKMDVIPKKARGTIGLWKIGKAKTSKVAYAFLIETDLLPQGIYPIRVISDRVL